MTVPIDLEIDTAIHERLIAHLRGSSREELAFMTAVQGALGVWTVGNILCVEPEDLAVHTDYHLRLRPDARGRIIRWSHERHGMVIEAHAHRSSRPARFSPSDMAGLDEWVPHVRWRLGGRPYGALVFGDDSFDALVWTKTSPVSALGGLRVGLLRTAPTGLTSGEAYIRGTW